MNHKSTDSSWSNSTMLPNSNQSFAPLTSTTVVGVAKSKRPTKTPTKRFASRAEEFCAFMTSLGYQLPKYTKPEHYDYLFQEEETSKIVRQMMKEIKPKHVLDPDEIARFNKLKSEGRALYGVNLEEALERLKAREMQRSKFDQAVIDKDKELDQLIAEKQEQIRQIKAIDKVTSEAIRQREIDERIARTKEESRQLHSKRLDQEIQQKRDELVGLTEILQTRIKSIHANISSGSETEKPMRLCDMDWLKMLEEEDKLNLIVKSMFEKYGADLIRQEIGGSDLGVEDEFGNPIETEAACRMFKQHGNHLERLKHVIIHEKIREIDMDIEMAGCQAVLQNMNKIIDEAVLLSTADAAIRSRMLREIQQTCESLELTLRREKLELYDTERHEETTRLNAEVKEIVDMRSRAKRKSHEFFAFLINVLVHQRVRVDLVRELVRAERTKNEHFAWKLQDYRNSILHSAQKEEAIQSELTGCPNIEPELLEAFEKYRIPISMYQNPLTCYQALLAAQSQSNLEKESQARREEQEFQLRKKKLFQQIGHLETLTKNLAIQSKAKSPMDITMLELEQVHRNMEDKLKFHELHKERLAQEAISKQLNLVRDVQEMLAEYNGNRSSDGSNSIQATSDLFPITNH